MQLAALEVCANLESWVYPRIIVQKSSDASSRIRAEEEVVKRVKQSQANDELQTRSISKEK